MTGGLSALTAHSTWSTGSWIDGRPTAVGYRPSAEQGPLRRDIACLPYGKTLASQSAKTAALLLYDRSIWPCTSGAALNRSSKATTPSGTRSGHRVPNRTKTPGGNCQSEFRRRWPARRLHRLPVTADCRGGLRNICAALPMLETENPFHTATKKGTQNDGARMRSMNLRACWRCPPAASTVRMGSASSARRN